MADNYFYPAIALVGGGDGALDSYPIADLEDGDGAIVITSAGTYTYYFDSTSTEAEDSPGYIRPDDYVDQGVWVLVNFAPDEFDVKLHASTHDPGGSDPIPLAVADTNDGLMSAEDKSTFDTPWDYKNRIINGDAQLWQRGTAASSGAGYAADRWFMFGNNNVPTMQRASIDLAAITGSESRYCMRVNQTANNAASHYAGFGQRIEGVRALEGKTATLSFWTYCTTDKKLAVTLRQNFGTGGSPSAEVNFCKGEDENFVSMTNAWTYHTMTVDIPTVSGKTLGTALDDYLYLLFFTDAGADFDVDPYYIDIGYQTLQMYIADIQLEEGPQATAFAKRPFTIEELLCHRYYWRMSPGQLSGNAYADNAAWSWRFGPNCSMRTTPTGTSSYTGVSYSNTDTLTWIVTYANEKSGGRLYFQSTGVATAIYVRFASTDYIALSAEL